MDSMIQRCHHFIGVKSISIPLILLFVQRRKYHKYYTDRRKFEIQKLSLRFQAHIIKGKTTNKVICIGLAKSELEGNVLDINTRNLGKRNIWTF